MLLHWLLGYVLPLKARRRSSERQRVSFILLKVSNQQASGLGIHTISVNGIGKDEF